MLSIPRRLLDAIIAHALEEDPNECCGILAGSGNAVSKMFRVTNSEKSPTRYLMDPEEQFAAFKEIRREGFSLLAIYHSHTHTPAYPSPTDIELAYYPEAHYLIVSLEKRSVPAMRMFRILEGKVTEERWTE